MPMRLTLRTMLAYMEDVLEPVDSQELAKKIEESEFATNLMHRIRDVTRRLRLAAPKLDGKGIGLDPNTVAEYLDNLLPSERVADFEKVCLESDVHLAEVASCHQILALILGAPAEIDPAMRDRMYKVTQKLVAPAQPAAIAAPPVSITAPPVESADSRLERKRPEVPDYLRESSKALSLRSMLAIAAVLLLLIGGGAVVAMQMGYFSNVQPGKVVQAPPAAPAAAPSVTPTDSGGTTIKTPVPVGPPNTDVGGLGSPPPTPPVGTPPPGTLPTMPQPQPDTAIPGTVTGLGTGPGPTTGAATNGVMPPTPIVVQPPVVSPTQPIPAGPLGGGQPQTPAVGINPTPPGTIPGTPLGVPPTAGFPGVTPPVTAPPFPAQPPAAMPPAGVGNSGVPLVASNPAKSDIGPPITTTTGIGRLISEHEVLLRLDPATKLWKRLVARTSVSAGDRLLSLPSYRANLTLGPSLSLQMLGGTSAELLPPDAHDVPGVELIDGRLLVLPLGKPGAALRLKVGNREAYIVFQDADATLALEVERHRNDGTNPQSEPASVVLDVYATAGEVRWSDSGNPQVDILKAPAHRVFADTPPGPEAPEFTAQDFPNWIKKPDERTPIEKRGSDGIDEALNPDRPITLGLKELSTDKRYEISSLALQCLAEIDEFEPFVTSLADSSQRKSWNTQVDALRRAIARSPETATLVREAFEHHRGPKGSDLYRMLWGYSVEQLQAGAAAQLVKYLDSEDLDFRVLSFWNLSRIAGASHYYQPEYTAVKRAAAVRAWKQKLDSGQLIPKSTDAKP